jgi:hypothetical protein
VAQSRKADIRAADGMKSDKLLNLPSIKKTQESKTAKQQPVAGPENERTRPILQVPPFRQQVAWKQSPLQLRRAALPSAHWSE